jgi:hypothetical protein
MQEIADWLEKLGLVDASESEGLIFVQAVSGFSFMVHRNGFAMVALK